VTDKDLMRVDGLLKRMKHHLDGRFTGTPRLAVLGFLGADKEAMDINLVSEGFSVYLLPHALYSPARQSVKSL
jgi:hypothetical protein